MDVSKILNKSECSVSITKNSKGYNWEIKVYDEDKDQAIEKLKKANDKMLTLYPQG